MEWKLSPFEERFFRIISLIIFIPAVSYIAYNKIFNNEPDWSKYYEFIIQEEYYGIVTKKYVDLRDHAIEKIVLDNGKTINLIDDHWYKKFEIGDSLYKEIGSLEIFLIKPTKDTLVFNYRDIEK